MIDLHHHLLPGIDDGSPDIETSVLMAKIAVEDGITHVVCTPHASAGYSFRREEAEAKILELRAELARESVPLALGLGCDFHINHENVRDVLIRPSNYTVNGKSYLLIELPDFGFTSDLTELFDRLQAAGLTLVLTHPERNVTLQRDYGLLDAWLRRGILMQVTAGSVLGLMGKAANRTAHNLLANQWVHFLATDAHDPVRRPPRMRMARDIVASKYGSGYAELLCHTNPLAAWEGEPLEERQMLESGRQKRAANSWWTRLLHR